MAYYWTCPHCGANLDPGERCDCLKGLKKPFRGEEMKNAKGLNKSYKLLYTKERRAVK